MPYNVLTGRNESDKKKFKEKGLMFIGKGFVKMGQYTSLSNKIMLDVARSHVILVAGKRGSGKSYTLGVLAEELSSLPKETSENIASLIFDTMGIYWTMKYKNEKDKDLLREWDLKPTNLPTQIFVPFGHFNRLKQEGIPADQKFALDPTEMNAEDWILTFNLKITNPIAVAIQKAINKLKGDEERITIKEITNEIKRGKTNDTKTINTAVSLFEAADTWGIFARENEKPTEVNDLIIPGKTSVLDLSSYNSVGAFNIRALVISLLSRKIFNQRMKARKKEEMEALSKGSNYMNIEKKEDPLIWIFVDECLSGSTEIETEDGLKTIKQCISFFEKGKKLLVRGYDTKTGNFGCYKVTNVFRKGKRKTIQLITETGGKLVCTPEHRVLTTKGFASAFSIQNIASPLLNPYSKKKKIVQARILGHLFGDGWITDKQMHLGFSGKGNKKDLEKIKSDLKELGFSSGKIQERMTSSKINNQKKELIVTGMSQSFISGRKAYKYFKPLAKFSGQKALSPVKIPSWLMKASIEEKREFLASLMGSDGNIISEVKNVKGDFNPIRFSFNKVELLRKDAHLFAKQIKKLFSDVGVSVTQIAFERGNLRKDGHKTIRIRLTLGKSMKNTIHFLERIGYRYCFRKEEKAALWLKYLKARVFLLNERKKVYQKAITLHKKNNWGKMKISRKLYFPEAQIRDWIYKRSKPGLPKDFPSFSEWTKKRYKNELFFEKISFIKKQGSQEVYDLSIEKVHNFISNGYITHNCHEFLPKEGKTLATDALVQLLREGRQPGISMVLATQQPGKIHTDVMTQSDIVISHRVTSAQDLEALNQIMQSYVLEGIKKQMNDLPTLKGSAILLDDNSERIFPIRIRPRFTWHGGEAPTALRIEKEYD